jgi:hypothetical protein
MFDWSTLTNTERAEILTYNLTVCESDHATSRPLKRRRIKDVSLPGHDGPLYYEHVPTDYAAELLRWERESQSMRLRPDQLARLTRGDCDYNVNGLIPDSPMRRASRLLDHFGPLTFTIARELAEIYELDAEQHFHVWRLAWETLLTLIMDHRQHPDPNCNEWLLECGLLDSLYDQVEGLFEDDVARIAEDDQEYLILRGRLAGMTSRQIAAECGVDKSTVNRRLREIDQRYNLN